VPGCRSAESLPVPRPEQLFIVNRAIMPRTKAVSLINLDRVRQQLPATTAIAAMGFPDDFYARTAMEQPQLTQGQLSRAIISRCSRQSCARPPTYTWCDEKLAAAL